MRAAHHIALATARRAATEERIRVAPPPPRRRNRSGTDSRHAAGQLQLAADKRTNCLPLTSGVVRDALAAEACYVGQTKETAMSKRAKRVDQLSRDDLDKFPVWRFVNDDSDELLVRPVTRIPIPNPSGHLLGTWLVLANGTRARALLGNVDVTDPRGTQCRRAHCTVIHRQVALEVERRWFV
jgi:hypothetical protein